MNKVAKAEIPMMDCPDHSDKWDCRCGHSNNVQVPDVAKMEMGIAKAEKDCDNCGGLGHSKEIPRLVCGFCKQTGKVPLIPGLREDCPAMFHDQPVTDDLCPICDRRTWVPDVTMQELWTKLNSVHMWLDSVKSETLVDVLIFGTEVKSYRHASPYIALLGAAWLAIQEMA